MKVNSKLAFNVDQTIHQKFREIASKYPNSPALDFNNTIYTYGELDNISDSLAQHLVDKLGTGKQQVAFFIDPGPDQIVAILGILKAGMTYVPLDVNFPSERNIYMIVDSQCSALISNDLNASQARLLSHNNEIININDIPSRPHIELNINVDPEDLMMIVYTSGSTGEPKGVMHSHKNIVHLISRLTSLVDISNNDVFAFYYSICFSAHALPIFSALLNGAKLSLLDFQKENFSVFTNWLKDKKVSVDLMIPSILRQFMATLKKDERIPSLRVLLSGGETLYKSDVDKTWPHLKKSSHIYNIYASSEAYVCSINKLSHKSIIPSNTVPIGNDVIDFELTIIDKDGNEREKNKVGEIQIKSSYLSEGYWNKEELTKEDFSRSSEPGVRIFRSGDLGYRQLDGSIVHVGRSDSMVKLRGYRIDLGEIENMMMQHTDIKESAVVVKENHQGTKHIVAYIVPKKDKDPDINYLKIAVLRMLPSYMVPTYFVKLNSLPKNDVGKTDKTELTDPDWNMNIGGKDFVEAENPVQEELVEIFERLLEVNIIGIKDNIMDLGADSLRLFVAFDEVEKKFGQKLDIDAIVDNPTIQYIAGLIIDN